MSLQGGNDPQTRATMQSAVATVQYLAAVDRAQLDTLTMSDLLELRSALLRLLPRTIDMCDVRLRQSLSRAKVGRRG